MREKVHFYGLVIQVNHKGVNMKNRQKARHIYDIVFAELKNMDVLDTSIAAIRIDDTKYSEIIAKIEKVMEE